MKQRAIFAASLLIAACLCHPAVGDNGLTLGRAIEHLERGDKYQQGAIAARLIYTGPHMARLVPALVKASKSEKASTRQQVVRVLGEIGQRSDATVSAVRARMTDDSALVRIEAALALFRITKQPDEPVRLLLLEMRMGNKEVRRRAANKLPVIDRGPPNRDSSSPDALHLLMKALAPDVTKSPYAHMVTARVIARAIGRLGLDSQRVAIPALRKALASERDVDTRIAIANALWDVGAPAKDVLPVLLRIIDEQLKNGLEKPDPRFFLRKTSATRIAKLLAKLGPEAAPAAERLAMILDAGSNWGRLAAADAIAAIGPGAVVTIPALLKAAREGEVFSYPFAHHSWNVSENASRALRLLGRKGMAALVALLQDKRASVRKYAAVELGHAKPLPATAVLALLRILNDKQPEVRAAGALSLGETYVMTDQVIDRLVNLLYDSGEAETLTGRSQIGTLATVGEHAAAALFLLRPSAESVTEALAKNIQQRGSLPDPVLQVIRRLPGVPDSLTRIVRPLFDNEDTRRSAAVALAWIDPNTPGLTEVLGGHLTTANGFPDDEAVRALGQLGPRAVATAKKMRDAGSEAIPVALVKIEGANADTLKRLAAALVFADPPETDDTVEGLRIWRANAQAARGIAPQLVQEYMTPYVPGLNEPLRKVFWNDLGNRQNRVRCAKLLLSIDSHRKLCLDTLIEVIDSERTEGGEAADVAAELGPRAKRAVPALIRQLANLRTYSVGSYGNDGQQYSVNKSAAAALKRIGMPAAPKLRQALRHHHPMVRSQSAELLGQIRAADTVDDLTKAVTDPSPLVRTAACHSLGQLGFNTPSVRRALERASTDHRLAVRDAASKAIRRLDNQ
jgi:HEAT repeat protein